MIAVQLGSCTSFFLRVPVEKDIDWEGKKKAMIEGFSGGEKIGTCMHGGSTPLKGISNQGHPGECRCECVFNESSQNC